MQPGQRPFRTRSDRDLATAFEHALAGGDGIVGAHCIHERWMRGHFCAHIETDLDLLWKRAGASIPDWLPMRYISWLPTAYDVAARFTAHSNGKGGGRSNIYLILLDYSDRRRDDHGVYVGMSRYSPAQRFDQHKNGIRAAGSVLKRGIEVLTGPTLHLQHLKRSEAARIETALAVALADASIHVEGGH
jgi:predicted GIY-YIG superfamily endonuclease